MPVKPENALNFVRRLHGVSLWKATKKKHHDYLNYIEELIKKDILVRPIIGQDDQDWVRCKTCNHIIGVTDCYWMDKDSNFCPNCSQRIDDMNLETNDD